MKKWVSVFLLFFMIGMPLQGQTLPAKGTTDLDAVLRNAVSQGVVPEVVAMVASKDRILYQRAIGLKDVANKKSVSPDAIFRIASMTKPVTSVAIMMLQEQGKLHVDDPVSKYLPDFKNPDIIVTFDEISGATTTRKASNELLIRHLLTHTSGLAYPFSNAMTNRLQQRGKLPEAPPLLYEPSTQWTYSPSTKVLGRIVEVVSGMRLDGFFAQRIFIPLGMTDTSFAVSPDRNARVVTVHRRRDGILVETPNPAVISSPVAGDGGLNSTAEDYIKFLQMLLNNGKGNGQRILRKESVDAMTKNQIGQIMVETQPAVIPTTSGAFPIGAGRDKFGFGFQITLPNNGNKNLRAPGSYSWAGIYNTHFWVDPKRKIAAVILMQVLPFYDEGCMKVYQDFEAAIGRNLR